MRYLSDEMRIFARFDACRFVILLAAACCSASCGVGPQKDAISNQPLQRLKSIIVRHSGEVVPPQSSVEDPMLAGLGDRLARIAFTRTDYWVAAHAILALGPSGYNLRQANPFRNELFGLFLENKSDHGPFVIRNRFPIPRRDGRESESEVHKDQYLHVFAMAGIPRSTSLVVNGNAFTIEDLLASAAHETTVGQELPWTISAMCTYRPAESWTNKFGELITFEQLLESGISSSDDGLTCFGTHRILALAKAFTYCSRSGKPGIADRLLAELKCEADHLISSQSENGAFVPRSLHRDKTAERVWTFNTISYTGHSFEWLGVDGMMELVPSSALSKAVAFLRLECARACDDFEESVGSNNSVDRIEFAKVCHAVSGMQRVVPRMLEAGPIEKKR